MKNKLICELNKIASNKFLIQKYFPLLEISTNVSMLHRVSLIFVKIHYKFFNDFIPKKTMDKPCIYFVF